ncbi:3'-5' exonuclease [Desulfurispira natronophila]|uniref:DNA polymerase-3 subunit epsilon n=1 Tax=Desulfurispira natronophila TaxID=682562 RepID=A0A7W7Y390_9BACT|nr:3'-5' exonuclease [Desulfurispira natronophila]MBB5021290.1 DNA polymerase-3 subunit epsilon [Desulfurispira natronophila]
MESFVAIDVETTGLSPARGARVIEIAAVKVVRGQVTAELCSLIQIGVPVSAATTRVHGITTAMLAGQPTPGEIWPQFLWFIEHHPIVAHNAPFDMRFAHSELQRLGLSMTNPSHCTLKIGRRKYPRLPSHKLEYLARHVLGKLPPGIQLHRALGDAHLTAMVWEEMNNALLGENN